MQKKKKKKNTLISEQNTKNKKRIIPSSRRSNLRRKCSSASEHGDNEIVSQQTEKKRHPQEENQEVQQKEQQKLKIIDELHCIEQKITYTSIWKEEEQHGKDTESSSKWKSLVEPQKIKSSEKRKRAENFVLQKTSVKPTLHVSLYEIEDKVTSDVKDPKDEIESASNKSHQQENDEDPSPYLSEPWICSCMTVTSTDDYIAFGDTKGNVHLYSVLPSLTLIACHSISMDELEIESLHFFSEKDELCLAISTRVFVKTWSCQTFSTKYELSTLPSIPQLTKAKFPTLIRGPARQFSYQNHQLLISFQFINITSRKSQSTLSKADTSTTSNDKEIEMGPLLCWNWNGEQKLFDIQPTVDDTKEETLITRSISEWDQNNEHMIVMVWGVDSLLLYDNKEKKILKQIQTSTEIEYLSHSNKFTIVATRAGGGIHIYETHELKHISTYGQGITLHGHPLSFQQASFIQNKLIGVPHAMKEPIEMKNTLFIWNNNSNSFWETMNGPLSKYNGLKSLIWLEKPQILLVTTSTGHVQYLEPHFKTDWAGKMYPSGYKLISDNINYIEDEDELDQIIPTNGENNVKGHETLDYNDDEDEQFTQVLKETIFDSLPWDVVSKEDKKSNFFVQCCPRVFVEKAVADENSSEIVNPEEDLFLQQFPQWNCKEILKQPEISTKITVNALTRSNRRGRSNYDAMLQASIDIRLTQAMREKEKWANGDGSIYSIKYFLNKNTETIECPDQSNNEQSEKDNTNNQHSDNGGKHMETEKEQEKKTSCAESDNQTKKNFENSDQLNLPTALQSKGENETSLTENICRQKLDQSKRKCAACLGRFVLHTCGNRSIPEDLEALWLARQKEKEMEEQRKKEESKRRRARTIQKKKEEKDRREAEAAALRAKEEDLQGEKIVENKIESSNEQDTSQTGKKVDEKCIDQPAVQDQVGTTFSLENSTVNNDSEETVHQIDHKPASLSSSLKNYHHNEENRESSAASSTTSIHNYDVMNNSLTTESTKLPSRTVQTSKDTIAVNYDDDVNIDLHQYQIDLRNFHHYNQFVNNSTNKHLHQSCQTSNHMNNPNVANLFPKRIQQQLPVQNHYQQNNVHHQQNTSESQYTYQNQVENKSHHNNHQYITHSSYDIPSPIHYSTAEPIRSLNDNFNENKYYNQSIPPSFEPTNSTNSNNLHRHNTLGEACGSIPGQSLNMLAAASHQRESTVPLARSSFHHPTNKQMPPPDTKSHVPYVNPNDGHHIRNNYGSMFPHEMQQVSTQQPIEQNTATNNGNHENMYSNNHYLGSAISRSGSKEVMNYQNNYSSRKNIVTQQQYSASSQQPGNQIEHGSTPPNSYYPSAPSFDYVKSYDAHSSNSDNFFGPIDHSTLSQNSNIQTQNHANYNTSQYSQERRN